MLMKRNRQKTQWSDSYADYVLKMVLSLDLALTFPYPTLKCLVGMFIQSMKQLTSN